MNSDYEYTEAARKIANACLEIALAGRQELAEKGFPADFVANFIPNAATTFLATALELMYQELSDKDLSAEKTWDKILEHKAKIGPLIQNLLAERASEDGFRGILRKRVETEPDADQENEGGEKK